VHRSDRLRGGLGYAHRRHVAVERPPRRGEFADPDGCLIALLAGARGGTRRRAHRRARGRLVRALAGRSEPRGALRWVRRHGPRYGVDPRRLGALGSSAGAHLVALLGVTRTAASPAVPRLRAVVSWSAPFDLSAADAPALAPAIVPIEQARSMAARLREAGVPHRLSVLPGSAHGMDYADVALGPSVRFLRRRLR